MDGTALVLTAGMLNDPHAKTAHGLLRGTERFQIVGIVDNIHAGSNVADFVENVATECPIFHTITEAIQTLPVLPQYCIIGVATSGGKLSPLLIEQLGEALQAGMHVVNGLHEFVSDQPDLLAIAEKNRRQIIDIRKPKPTAALHFWSGKIAEVTCPKIAILGTDCAVGKRTTAQLLVQTLRARGKRAEMVYTGQTGWLQGWKYGFILDATLNDFVSGELEHAIYQCYHTENPDFILVEGQSALRNPSGPCGAELLVSGQMDGVILQYRPAQQYFGDTTTWGKIPSLASEIELIRLYGVPTLAIALNTNGLSTQEAEKQQDKLQAKLDIPVYLPLQQENTERLADQLIHHFTNEN